MPSGTGSAGHFDRDHLRTEPPSHLHRPRGEAIVEVLAKAARTDLGPEVPVRGREDAHIDLARRVFSYALVLPFLEHAQEFRLQLEGKVPELVQKDGPPVRQLEPTGPVA